nr:MAG TPA: hypothetical protein [Caudoviricetes sp.]
MFITKILSIFAPCSGRGLQEALKMVDESEDGKQTAGTQLNRYLNQKILKLFIYKGKEPDHFNPIICYKGAQKNEL